METGRRIAERYVVTGPLGAGGMGVVLRARDERLGRNVAIKLLQRDALGSDEARARLVREARSAAALDHPNIVHIYDVGETDDGGAFLVMELVAGKSLADHVRDGSLATRQRTSALVEVARALQYAHDQGVLHRDVKPDNVMIREDGRAVVLDFGLAKSVAPELASTVDARSLTAKGLFVGTPAYAAPEQIRGEPLDPRADVFSFAVSSFEVLTGVLPWRSTSGIEVISEILQSTPRRVREVAPDLPQELDDALAHAMARDRTERTARVADLADLLETLDAPSVRWVAKSPPSPAAKSVAVTDGSAPIAKRPARRQRNLTIAALVAAALAASNWYARRSPSQASTAGGGPAASSSAAFAAGAGVQTSIACVPLRSTIDQMPQSGWLGAAAASFVCERARIVIGGSTQKTLVPAELLSLPREPIEGFPLDAYEGDARDKALAAAKTRASATIDGSVAYLPGRFTIDLTLLAPDGRTLGHGTATAPTLPEAVARAMDTWIGPNGLGAFAAGEPRAHVTAAYPGASTAAALELLDLTFFVLNEDLAGARETCDRLQARSDVGTMMGYVRTLCANTLFETLPKAEPLDTSSTEALATTAASLGFHRSQTDVDRAKNTEHRAALHAAAEMASGQARALLFAVEAEFAYQALGATEDAARAARESILASPKQVDVRGTAWHRLGFTSRDTNLAIVGAHAAWLPWESYAQSTLGRAPKKSPAEQRDYVARAAILSQRGYWANFYGDTMISLGNLEQARGIQTRTKSQYLHVLLDFAEGYPGRALLQAGKGIDELPANGLYSLDAARTASTAADLSDLIGRPADDVTDRFVAKFVDPAPPALSHGIVTFFSALTACSQSRRATAERCLARLEQLVHVGHFGGGFAGADDALVGSKRYVAKDWAGAAKAWRPLVSKAAFITDTMRGPMVAAFERAGEDELVERMDTAAVTQQDTHPNAALAYGREALRAEKRKDFGRARTLATEFAARWASTDERPVMLAEMKKLLARLPR